MLRPPRDHDIVEDLSGKLYVVVGNLHPPGKLIAYLKYVPTVVKTLWARGDIRYDRVLRTYGVGSLHRYLRKYQEFSYDYVLGAYVPVVSTSSIVRYYYPEVRLVEILSRVDDELELAVVEFTDMLRDYAGITTNCLGVTGSLLTRTHNVRVSDADIVIYGCRYVLDFMEHLEDLTHVRSGRIDLLKQSEVYGLDVNVLARINPPYKKFLVRGKEINVIFVDDSPPPRYGSMMYVCLGPIEAVVQVRSGDCRSLMYPSIAQVDRVVNVTKGNYVEDQVRSIHYVVSYEGLYSYVLFLGGVVAVKGILQAVLPDSYYQIMVGGIEEPGYVVPLGTDTPSTTLSVLRNT